MTSSRLMPWSKFFWADYENDLDLRLCSLAAQGLWMRLLCLMARSEPYGHLVVHGKAATARQVAALVGRPEAEITPLLEELQGKGLWNIEAATIHGAMFASKDRRPRLASSVWRALRGMIFERDDFTCTYCGAYGVRLECDHVIPASRGGSNEPENLATACLPCNRRKGAKTPEEWRQ